MSRKLVHGGVAVLGLVLAGVSTGCRSTESVEYLTVEPASVENDAFVVDAGMVPAGVATVVEVEFWNIGDEAWRMSLTPTGGDVGAVSVRCEQDYDCTYVAPRSHSIWTFEVAAGTAGHSGALDTLVSLESAVGAEPLDATAVVLQWTTCGDGGPPCEESGF